MKTAEALSLNAHSCDHSFIFYLNYFSLNPFEMVTWHRLYFAMKVASLVNEWRPAPPSPTSIPCPLLNLMILLILQTYEMAASKSVIFIAADLYFSLNSTNLSSIIFFSYSLCFWKT